MSSGAFGFDEAGVRRIVGAVRSIEQQAKALRALRPGIVNGTGRFFIVVQLASSLSAGGSSASAVVYEWSGSAWSSTSETVTVRDFRPSGTAVDSGKRCVCVPMFDAWWVIATNC